MMRRSLVMKWKPHGDEERMLGSLKQLIIGFCMRFTSMV